MNPPTDHALTRREKLACEILGQLIDTKEYAGQVEAAAADAVRFADAMIEAMDCTLTESEERNG